jgi:hypothetical protein
MRGSNAVIEVHATVRRHTSCRPEADSANPTCLNSPRFPSPGCDSLSCIARRHIRLVGEVNAKTGNTATRCRRPGLARAWSDLSLPFDNQILL